MKWRSIRWTAPIANIDIRLSQSSQVNSFFVWIKTRKKINFPCIYNGFSLFFKKRAFTLIYHPSRGLDGCHESSCGGFERRGSISSCRLAADFGACFVLIIIFSSGVFNSFTHDALYLIKFLWSTHVFAFLSDSFVTITFSGWRISSSLQTPAKNEWSNARERSEITYWMPFTPLTNSRFIFALKWKDHFKYIYWINWVNTYVWLANRNLLKAPLKWTL